MSFNREADPKNDFLSFFKDRYRKTEDENLKERLATEADPYARVGSGKPQKVVRERNYRINPDELDANIVDEANIRTRSSSYSSRDALAEAYSALRDHGAVRLGAQREDGSWEAFGVEREVPKTTGSAFGAAATRQPVDESSAAFVSGLLKTIKPFS